MAASQKGLQLRDARELVSGTRPAGSRGAGGTWLLFRTTCHAPAEVLALPETSSSGAVLHLGMKWAPCPHPRNTAVASAAAGSEH